MGRFLAILAALIAGVCLPAQSAVDSLSLSVKPGVYRQDQILVIGSAPGFSVRYRFAGSRGDGAYLPVSTALSLSAMEGETRDYRLGVQILKDGKELEKREIQFTIDKSLPANPEPDQAPGTWYQALTLTFSLPPASVDDRIRLSWTASDGSSQAASDGASLQLTGKSGAIVTYRVQAWAEDPAKQSGAVQVWVWNIDRRREREIAEIPVLSPVEGRFQNPQYLYIDQLSFAQLRFTTDGSDPRVGQAYTRGVLLPQTGRVQVRIWGKTLLGKELERAIVYEAGNERLTDLESGSWGQTHVLQFSGETFYYTAGERQPTPADETLSAPLRITPQTGALRGVALRLLRARDQAVFRYYLILDGRQPQMPEIWARSANPLTQRLETVQSGQSIQDKVLVDIKASDGSQVWYTVNGKNPDADPVNRRAAGSSLALLRSELQSVAAANQLCTLSFQAQQADGQWGPVAAIPVHCGARMEAPQVQVKQLADGSLQFASDRSGSPYWYMVSSDFHDRTHQGPFLLPNNARLELPYGAAGSFSFTFFRMSPENQSSLPQGPVVVQAANVAPADPVVKVSGGRLVEISGTGLLRYRILADKPSAPSITKQALNYDKPFLLQELSAGNVTYTVEAWAEDTGGRSSAIVRSEGNYLHTSAPQLPEIANEGTDIYRSMGAFRLLLAHPEAGMRYHYQIGPLGTVSDPDPGNAWVEREIPVQSGSSDGILELRMRAASSVRPELVSGVSRFLIHVMTLVPPGPVITGVSDGLASRIPLEISLDSKLPGVLSYRLVQGDIKSDTPWLEYRQAVTVPAPPDSNATWRFQARFKDRAGNISEPSPVSTFRIITGIPDLPDIMVKDVFGTVAFPDAVNEILSRSNLYVDHLAAEGLTLRMVLVSDRNLLKLPDSFSAVWEKLLPLEQDPGQEASWYLQYRAFDEAGNMSPPSPVYTITVDRAAPRAPEKPLVVRQGNGGTLSWNSPENVTIEYLFNDSSAISGSPKFLTYNGERVAWSLPDATERLFLYYRSRDRALNYSEIQNVVIDRNHQAPLPRISGIIDGGVYREPVTITLQDATVDVTARYELTLGDQGRIEASNLSSLMGSQLEIGPISGETVQYHLSVRQFADGLDPSDPLDLDFTIDRTPPQAPTIVGLPALSYIAKDLTLIFEAEAGAEIWYSLQSTELSLTDAQDSFDFGQLAVLRDQLAAKKWGNETLVLAGKPDRVMRYVMFAWSQDTAGNRSKVVPSWQVFIDAGSVYVRDPLGTPPGQDSGPETGSRTQPFRDIERAIQFARSNHKSSLRLGYGRYPLRHRVDLDFDLVLTGGYNPDSWSPSVKEASIVYPQAGYTDPQLLLTGKTLTLQHLFLADSGQRLGKLIEVNGGSLDITACNLAITQSDRAILVNGGTCRIAESVVSCNDPLSTTVIDVISGKLTLLSSTVESTELPPVLLKNQARAEYRLISGLDSTLTIRDSDLYPRRGKITTAIRLRGGSLELGGKTVSCGAGAESATAIDLMDQATAHITDCQILGNPQAGNTVLVRSLGSLLTVDACAMQLVGNAGIYGFLVEDSTVRVKGTTIQAGRAMDFMTVVSAKASKLEFAECQIGGTDTADFRVASLQAGESLWHGNTFLVRGGSQANASSGLFFLNQAGQHVFTNNTLTGDDQHTLFYLATLDGTLTVRNNIIEHWRFILQEIQTSLSRQSDTDRGINSLQLLEGTRRQGSLFEGNKVRQGL